MGAEFYFVAVILLGAFAVIDLMVGVSNDAVNFLNSSIGSRVAPRHIIMFVASLGILAGVLFSSGMMEVARKGIFHPQFFTMPELITLFLAVMLTDIILLDLFNSYGLPTSTTVSIVFELLGAAVAISVVKIAGQNGSLSDLARYINTSKAMIIIFGILLSVVVAFICGAVLQFLSRLLFTFEFSKQLRRYGAVWGGLALAFITYFILVKGAKGASFITPDTQDWIKSHTFTLLGVIAAGSAMVLQLLLLLKVNILKPIVLIGTFALAMAFAANDLVNFIGVPMAGLHSYRAALNSDSPLTATMEALSAKVPTETYLLLLAGLIMVVTLWISKKARTVTKTEVDLGRQTEGEERFESVFLARMVVRMVINLFNFISTILPRPVADWFARRLDTARYQDRFSGDNQPSFDLLRAAVNLMAASAVISYATSHKLPLSTTYVTFMVAMGTSFADLAWGRESAVYRVTGVLTVIGGWFMTALSAFTISAFFAVILFYTGGYGVAGLLLLAGLLIWKSHHRHKERAERAEKEQVFNLRKISDPRESISVTFGHMGTLIHEIRESLDSAFEALFNYNDNTLRAEKQKTKKFQNWSNIIIANSFKCMRLLEKSDETLSHKYAQTIRRLQKLVDGHRDIILRSRLHISNHHKPLLPVQITEIREIKKLLMEILLEAEETLHRKNVNEYSSLFEKDRNLRNLAEKYNQYQIQRIKDDTSKTRLSILYYAVVGNAMMLSKQVLKLMEIFHDAFSGVDIYNGFDMD